MLDTDRPPRDQAIECPPVQLPSCRLVVADAADPHSLRQCRVRLPQPNRQIVDGVDRQGVELE